ncbi:D-alanyl-D-alanine carboxypeptidase/D-alanyl-D-alanine-endopeptidase [Riemerella anatipestifer]|nr:D-alanyl-D-alanine carboxypeptidase/D-alanyl-D-alanine-endopeptidase [Riemerella anatipestifer]AGC40456.1 hypothetical protein G148_1152 [Riemerella anatipestifer RA-CH-2]MDY3515927.1 D-alanyl-D-alanine carboxypeptidase/D-alanyl-D-alanine-endopeptidase [Riemerella anatipestifer]
MESLNVTKFQSMNLTKKGLLIACISIFFVSFAQYSSSYPTYETPTAEKVTLSAKEELDIAINQLASDPMVRNGQWGFVVYDPKSKQIISSYNEATPLVPASTTKLLTTDAAMNIMGSKFKYNTQLEYSGKISDNGVLEGNLYIIGSGDPTLGTGTAGSSSYGSISSDFIYAIKNLGITKINGNIFIQTAVFKGNNDSLPANIVWLERENYYLPVGRTANIDPTKERKVIKRRFRDDEKRFFYVSPYTNQMAYTDSFEGNTVTGKIPSAPYSLANTLRASLLKSGVAVTGKVEGKTIDIEPENRTFITKYQSPSLDEIVYFVNQTSNNRFAEALLRSVGFYKNGDESLETGRQTIVEHLNANGYDFNGLNLMDGSGLSRSNLVTPISQVKFLAGLMKERYYKSYFDSLPIAGQTGTLKKMFLYNEGYGQIFAKTGTLRAVKCLAGYINTKSGRTLTFSLLINNYTGSVHQIKAKMEKLLEPALNL